jgi:hypothetical protein
MTDDVSVIVANYSIDGIKWFTCYTFFFFRLRRTFFRGKNTTIVKERAAERVMQVLHDDQNRDG